MPGEESSPAGQGSQSPQSEILHASCVATNERAVLIIGASGSGKSALALDLISRGASLVSDDRTVIKATSNGLVAEAPSTIKGLIAARGVGILNASALSSCQVALVVDLDQKETARLPKHYTFTRLGVTLPLLYRVPYPHFSSAILQFLIAGRSTA
jgi:HPr kinase/phosphorylase